MIRTDAGVFYIGTSRGLEQYGGYLDSDTYTYDLSWLTHPLSFGVPGNLKFLKNFDLTLDNGSGYDVVVKWSWDYNSNYTTSTIAVPNNSIAEFGVGEYGVSEFSASIALLSTSTTAGGSGKVLTTGATTTINDESFSIQQFEIQATIGRVL
jgi:hypothetical protein